MEAGREPDGRGVPLPEKAGVRAARGTLLVSAEVDGAR